MSSEAKYTIFGTVLVRPGGQHVGNAATESDAIGLKIELDGLTAQRDAAVEACKLAKGVIQARNGSGKEIVHGDVVAYDALSAAIAKAEKSN